MTIDDIDTSDYEVAQSLASASFAFGAEPDYESIVDWEADQ